MRICLLTCDAPFLIDQKVFPPLGLLAVGTALRREGNDVRIQDTPDDSKRFGLGPTTSEYASALVHLNEIKEQNKTSVVIIGGPHAVANPQECLADGFDVVVIGDGENMRANLFSYSGVVNLGQMPIENHPISDRSIADIAAYRYEINGRPATTLMSTRGCPYRCGFCAKTETKSRFYSAERMEREIAYLQEGLGYSALMFFDDTFIVDKDRTLQMCKAMKDRGILWRCFVRGDLVVRHGRGLLEQMADSGCVEVGIGIESASAKILQTINKGESIETIRLALCMLRSTGIRAKGFFILGLPGESPETIEETRKFVRLAPLDALDFSIYQPYRGSPIWEQRAEYDVAWELQGASNRFYKGRMGEYQCSVSTSSMTSEQIKAARDGLEEEFPCR